MSNAIKLLDKYVAVCSHPNDSATGRALRVTPQTINNWRHGRSQPNAESIERMCQAIGEPLRTWLPLIEADRARTPADKRVWLRLAQAAAAVALTIGLLPAHAGTVETVHTAALSGSHDFAPVYIMRNYG
jgi:hypothetical protein